MVGVSSQVVRDKNIETQSNEQANNLLWFPH